MCPTLTNIDICTLKGVRVHSQLELKQLEGEFASRYHSADNPQVLPFYLFNIKFQIERFIFF